MPYYNSKGEEVRFAYGVDAVEALAAGLVFDHDPTAVKVKKVAPKTEPKVELPEVKASDEEEAPEAPKRKAPRRRASAEE